MLLLLVACVSSGTLGTIEGDATASSPAGTAPAVTQTGGSDQGHWPSACPEPTQRAGCRLVSNVLDTPREVITVDYDEQGREVFWEQDKEGDGVWDLRKTTTWDGDVRQVMTEVPGSGPIEVLESSYRPDGQVRWIVTDDRITNQLFERELLYDELGRRVSDYRTVDTLPYERCTSTWFDTDGQWGQLETCRESIAARVWDVEQRLELNWDWDREGDGVADWVVETTYLDDCQVDVDHLVLPGGYGPDRFVTAHEYDDLGRITRTVVATVDDDGEVDDSEIVTEHVWDCP